MPRQTALLLLLLALVVPAAARAENATFESGQVRPLALSSDGNRLYVVNTPDARLEIFAVDERGLQPVDSVPVGLEPVAVAVRDDGEVWVVNHLSDSVSVVDVASSPPRVRRTLLVGDEPRDVVFAGRSRGRAFVTTAHRGQNRPGDPQLTTPGVGRADVWVFDASEPGAALGGTPETIVTLFTDTPRALAVSPDGATVYAAGFHTGNRTTAIHEGLVCDGGASAPPCDVSGHRMPGGLPAPNANRDGVAQPEVGLIVKHDGVRWRDGIGRDWSNAVRFTLPDRDVFAIDATADPPTARPYASGVGTILFAMVVDPVTGRLLVANTEARNEVRFEGPGTTAGSTVRGRLHEARVTVVERDGRAIPRRLNKHVDDARVPSRAGVAQRSLATPVALAISADGATTYVAAYGSSKIGVYDTRALVDDSFVPDASRQIELRGGGPSGIALDEARGRLYVLTRFDDGVSVVDTRARGEIAHVAMHDPEPDAVKHGRRLLYDARRSSSNGEASCAACHVFGDTDGLAWDLGNPDAPVVENRNPRHPGLQQSPDFHPMKGPMTTQTLRGLAGQGPLHWRGDRTGGLDAPSTAPGGGAYDERAGILKFDAAFVGLLGRAEPLPEADMQALADFVLAIRQPPNPIRNLDGSLTPDQAAGRKFFFESDPSDVSGPCAFCHVVDPARGLYGTDGHSVIVPEGAMKIPGLRAAYQKVGMFGMPHVPGRLAQFGFNATDHRAQGEQIRGFGFTHDGSVDTIYRFLHTRGFNFSRANRGGFTLDAAGDEKRRQVEQYVLAFDSDLAPIVGQQVTLGDGALAEPSVAARIALLIGRAEARDCDLIVKGVLHGRQRGWLYDPAAHGFRPDRTSEPASGLATLRAQAGRAGQERTFTCVPVGWGMREGIDRDADGVLDGDETRTARAQSATSAACRAAAI
ncbi:beta-propeller fold lactonase family protein, partial [Candidatus Binatia bacterium]|nr:beta-propeller fold lactonase family protein [Candidatus Binatia bacterium]